MSFTQFGTDVKRPKIKAENYHAEAAREDEDPLEWMIKKYGKKKGKKLFWSAELCGQICSSWECRDCAGLDEYEYFEKLQEQHAEKNRIKKERAE
jgi:hypothetical protein